MSIAQFHAVTHEGERLLGIIDEFGSFLHRLLVYLRIRIVRSHLLALAVARLLSEDGYQVSVYLFNVHNKLSADCATNKKRLTECKSIKHFTEITVNFDPPQLTEGTLVVDGLFGSGLKLNCFSKKNFGAYWFASGTPTYLINMLRKFSVLPTKLGKTLARSSAFDAPTENLKTITPSLYQSGYITIKGYDKMSQLFTLDLPNKEIKVGLFESLLPNYLEGMYAEEGDVAIAQMSVLIRQGDMDGALRLLQEFLGTVPYCNNNNYEGHYQQELFIIFTLLTHFVVDVEVHTAAFIIAAFSALRLAKFNLDERQTTSFIGVPTPTNALFWGSLIVFDPFWLSGSVWSVWIVLALILITSYLLVCEMPLFALKFKQWTYKGNEIKWWFAGFTLATLAIATLEGGLTGFFSAWWIIIVVYVLISAIKCLKK